MLHPGELCVERNAPRFSVLAFLCPLNPYLGANLERVRRHEEMDDEGGEGCS